MTIETVAGPAVADRPRPWVAWLVRLLSRSGTADGHGGSRRLAGSAFLIRAAGAAVVYLSQVLLARWMGGPEFGLYVYVWTWVLVLGDTIHLGLASAAQRLIPEYTQRRTHDLLRGFLVGSRALVFAAATMLGLAVSAGIYVLSEHLPAAELIPLYLACATLPFYALSNMLDGLARAFDRVGIALAPPYVLRPLLTIVALAGVHLWGLPVTTAAAMAATVFATAATALLQMMLLGCHLARVIEPGPRRVDVPGWLNVSLPILVAWGFYTLLTYIDILVLQRFSAPEQIAHYYAASKTLALMAFVHFAVSAVVAHRFTEYHVAADRARLTSFLRVACCWTFWPSLAAAALILASGYWLLGLFGAGFGQAYPLMFVLAIGLLARAAVGPAERLVSMLGEQRWSAIVYATAFAANLAGCLMLIPRFGPFGAAISTASAMVLESLMLFLVARYRLRLHVFVVGGRER